MATPELVRAYEAQSAFIRDRVLEFVLAVWGSASSYRDADVERIVARVVPAVQAGQLRLAALTDAYIGQVAREAGLSWVPSLDRSVVGYRGVPAVEVYRRPAVQLYTALSLGAQYADAVSQGQSRLRSITVTDLQQARNRQASRSVARSGFRYYRRVLTGAEDCDLCQLASQNRYSRDDLMPIHPGCDCGVEPLIEYDPEPLAGADTVTVNMHGELGPTLGWVADDFTGAADIPAL